MNELDPEIARVLDHISPGGMYWHEDQEAHLSTPAPYSSADYYTHMLEDEIERRGLVETYQDALIGVLGLDMQVHNSAIEINPHQDLPPVPHNTFKWDGHAFLWALIRATPEQRARAFLEAAKTGVVVYAADVISIRC